MSVVQETIDLFPFTAPPRVLQRREEMLLGPPAEVGPFKFSGDVTPLEAVHFPVEYAPITFAPPTGVYESDYLRLEWQTMNFRQPFYHRNTDVDELSYQIEGERTLMTELGTVELVPGDFSLIPRGVAHDNYGREESHLLYYIPAPVESVQAPVKLSELKIPAFPGWQPAPGNELITDCLGGPGHPPVAISPIDEQQLLEQQQYETERIQVLRPDADTDGTAWLYRSDDVMLGHALVRAADGRQYRRHLDVDEIQYQISGKRTLCTQRGTLHLEPGDLVRIPVGVAFASMNTGVSAHITLVSRRPIPRVAPPSRNAVMVTVDEVERMRQSGHIPAGSAAAAANG